LQRLMMAQDTGGAIKGRVRGDFFWGMGDQAGALAGRMKQTARFWVLLPREEITQ
jgi:membrane-bound lytic murein transglycosylase A